jgi:hypothetical protein
LYVSQNPIAGFVREELVYDFCSRYKPTTLHLFLASLDHVLGNLPQLDQQVYEDIKTALITMATNLEKLSKTHLILSSDRLTFQLKNESFSPQLTATYIFDVLTWPNEMIERLPEAIIATRLQTRKASAWK